MESRPCALVIVAAGSVRFVALFLNVSRYAK